MQALKQINVDLTNQSIVPSISAKQNDRDTRYIQFSLYAGSAPFTVPTGALVAFRYKKPDGTGGFYDTNEAGQPAISIATNIVTVELVEQVLTVPGTVYAELNLYTAAGEKLTTFTIEIKVQASVLADAAIVSSDYYNVLTAKVAEGAGYANNAASSATAAAVSADAAAKSAQSIVPANFLDKATYGGSAVGVVKSADTAFMANYLETVTTSNLNLVSARSYVMRYNAGTPGARSRDVGGTVFQMYHGVIDYYFQLSMTSDIVCSRYKAAGALWSDWKVL